MGGRAEGDAAKWMDIGGGRANRGCRHDAPCGKLTVACRRKQEEEGLPEAVEAPCF